ncbi:hypothetical protein QUC31_011765 [Theobroma cacao]
MEDDGFVLASSPSSSSSSSQWKYDVFLSFSEMTQSLSKAKASHQSSLEQLEDHGVQSSFFQKRLLFQVGV